MAFVFGTLAEFALVLTLARRLRKSEITLDDTFDGFNGKQRPSKRVFDNEENAEIKALEAKIMRLNSMRKISDSNSQLSGTNKTKMSHQLRITNMVDFGSFILFNLSYLLFNMIYWASYLK